VYVRVAPCVPLDSAITLHCFLPGGELQPDSQHSGYVCNMQVRHSPCALLLCGLHMRFCPPMATLQLLHSGRDGFGSGLRDEGKRKCGERENLLSQDAGLFLNVCTRHSRAATVGDDV
jgi:hypothetical protein